jgi:hypothetical protein
MPTETPEAGAAWERLRRLDRRDAMIRDLSRAEGIGLAPFASAKANKGKSVSGRADHPASRPPPWSASQVRPLAVNLYFWWRLRGLFGMVISIRLDASDGLR